MRQGINRDDEFYWLGTDVSDVNVIGASAGTPLCDRRTKLLLVRRRCGVAGMS